MENYIINGKTFSREEVLESLEFAKEMLKKLSSKPMSKKKRLMKFITDAEKALA